MRISILAIIALVGLVAAAPAKREEADPFDVGECNGTSCNVNWVNTECKDHGSCVGPGGGDGAPCRVMKGWGPAYCPVNCRGDYCP